MVPDKPAIVLVPGAWHIPAHYAATAAHLRTAGYEITVCDMPSVTAKTPLPGMEADITVVRAAIEAYIARDLNVVVVMHSLGGIIGSSASKGLLPCNQPNGKGVIKLLYVAALILDEGVSMFDFAGGQYSPYARVTGPPGTGVWLRPDNPPYDPSDVFYNDCTAEQAQQATEWLEMEYNENVAHAAVTYAAWKEVESFYLVCGVDGAIAVELQEWFSSLEGGKWGGVERWECGHVPFVSRPVDVGEWVRRCIGEEI